MAMQVFTRSVPQKVSRRKIKYKTDAGYRQKAQAASRRTYRMKKGVELMTCLHSLNFLDDVATEHQVKLPNGQIKRMRVLSIPKTAEMLQRLYQTLWRWIESGVVPAPVLLSQEHQDRQYRVYHVEEVRELIKIIGEHSGQVKYLRRDHKEVRERIEQRISELRKTLGISNTRK